MLGGLEEEEDDAGRDASDGKVDVEAPSPADVVGEGTAQEGTDDTGETVGGTDDAGEGRAVLGGSGESDDGVGSRAETCCAKTGDGTAGNEGFGGGGGATDDGTELEDKDGDEEGCLQGKVLVDFTPFYRSQHAWLCRLVGLRQLTCRLEGADCHEEGGSIPASLVETLEFVCDLGNGSCNNGLIRG